MMFEKKIVIRQEQNKNTLWCAQSKQGKRDLADERIFRFKVPFSNTAIPVDAILHANATIRNHLKTLRLLNVFLTGNLILADKVGEIISSEPIGQLGEFLTKTVDRLVIHVGLRD
jgi:hypothetical protein